MVVCALCAPAATTLLKDEKSARDETATFFLVILPDIHRLKNFH